MLAQHARASGEPGACFLAVVLERVSHSTRALQGTCSTARKPSRRTGLVEADGVVAAVVPELKLERGAAHGLAQDLVAHADAEHRLLAQHLLHVLHRIRHRARVALPQEQFKRLGFDHCARHRACVALPCRTRTTLGTGGQFAGIGAKQATNIPFVSGTAGTHVSEKAKFLLHVISHNYIPVQLLTIRDLTKQKL